MDSVKKKSKKQIHEQAVAPEATPTKASSKAWMMANVIDGMMKMAPADIEPHFQEWMSKIGTEADGIPDGAAAKNAASINSTNAMVSEELKEILETEALSEDTKERAAVLFESAVSTKVALIKAQLEEAQETKLNEEIDRINETALKHIDTYLTYVAEQWVKQNKVAVKRSIKTELTESLLKSVFQAFKEHNVSIPDDQVDAVEALSEELESVKKKLKEQVNENINFSRELEQYRKDEVIKQETEGLALTQVEKVKKLAEGVEFGNDMETFRKKVKILTESQTKTGKVSTPVTTETPVSKVIEESSIVDRNRVNDMNTLARYISQSVNK